MKKVLLLLLFLLLVVGCQQKNDIPQGYKEYMDKYPGLSVEDLDTLHKYREIDYIMDCFPGSVPDDYEGDAHYSDFCKVGMEIGVRTYN